MGSKLDIGLILLILLLSQVYCDTIYASPGNSTSGTCSDCSSVECPCSTLFDAVQQANDLNSSNITIILLPGIYTGENNTNLSILQDIEFRLVYNLELCNVDVFLSLFFE